MADPDHRQCHPVLVDLFTDDVDVAAVLVDVEQHVRNLEEFVRYKAMYGIARSLGDGAKLIDAFATWPSGSGDADAQDPRVLPLHVFDNERIWENLDAVAGRTDFAQRYGNAAHRLDCTDRNWSPATVGHGQDTLTVAGRGMPRGFHWDVNRGRAGGSRLVTCHEVWLLRHPRSYANVYPDAYVRGAPRGNARLVWSARP